MKPIRVDGASSEEVNEIIEKAKVIADKLEKATDYRDDSNIHAITGVEESRPAHYWTNNEQPFENVVTVKKKIIREDAGLIDGNPFTSGSTLATHENQG